MDWGYYWSHFLAAFCGAMSVGVYYQLKERFITYPVRWKCPEKKCNFRARTDKTEVLEVIKRHHFEDKHAPRFRRNT